MSNFAYRFPPCPSYDIEAMESWLEDMAKKGLILGQQGIIPGMVAFEKSTPQNIRYRLVASPHKYSKRTKFGYAPEPDEKTKQFHAEFGWDYIATRREFHIYAAKDPASPEMDTDPEVQAMAIKAVTNRLLVDIVIYLVLLGVSLALFAANAFDLLLSNTYLHSSFYLLFYTVFCSWGYFSAYFRLRRLRKQLQSGQPLSHRSNYRRGAPRYYLSKLAQVSIWILMFWLAFRPSGKLEQLESMVGLDEYTGQIPFATMREVLPDAQFREDSGWVTGITDWSTGASENIWLAENYHVTLPDGTETKGSLGVLYYDTTSNWLALELAEYLYDKEEGAQVILLDGVDYAFSWEDDDAIRVVFVKGEIMVDTTFQLYDVQFLTAAEFGGIIADSVTGE